MLAGRSYTLDLLSLYSGDDQAEAATSPGLKTKHRNARFREPDMADQSDVDLDSIIDRLLEVRGSRPGKQVQLLEAEIRHLCQKAREIFISQPILLELEAPIKASDICSGCEEPLTVLIALIALDLR